MVVLMLATAAVLVWISYLMLDILSGMVVTPKTPVKESAARGGLVIPLDGAEVTSMQVSADGMLLAYIERGFDGGETTLKVVETGDEGGEVFSQAVEGTTLAWLGGSGSLVYEDAGDIYRLDMEEGTQLNLTGDGEYDDNPLPAPDGDLILWTRSPQQPGSGNTEFWTMRSDGSEQESLAPVADLPAWSPSGGEVLSRSEKTTSVQDPADGYSVQKTWPGRNRWDFYAEGEGEIMYVWWPGQEDIYYVSKLYIEGQERIKGVLIKVDSEDPFEQKKVASTEGLVSNDENYRFYPSRIGEKLAYVGEKGLEVLDVDDRVITRFIKLDATVPLAWNEAAEEMYYTGPEGIYRISLEGEAI
jgi:hypothetical protein